MVWKIPTWSVTKTLSCGALPDDIDMLVKGTSTGRSTGRRPSG